MMNEARLGTVPSADTANTAANAKTLGGVGAAGFVRRPTEAVRLVGTAGNPGFAGSWKNSNLGASAGFFKDQFGVVHLQGDLDPPGGASTIFILPGAIARTRTVRWGPSSWCPATAGCGASP